MLSFMSREKVPGTLPIMASHDRKDCFLGRFGIIRFKVKKRTHLEITRDMKSKMSKDQ